MADMAEEQLETSSIQHSPPHGHTSSEEQLDISSIQDSPAGEQTSPIQQSSQSEASRPKKRKHRRKHPSKTPATHYLYTVTHLSWKPSESNQPTKNFSRAFRRLDSAIDHANTWWHTHLQPGFGVPLRFDHHTPKLPLEIYYYLCSDKRNFLGKPEEYVKQEVRVTKVWFPGSGRSITMEESQEEMEFERERRRAVESRIANNRAAGPAGHAMDEASNGTPTCDINDFRERGCFGEAIRVLRGCLCTSWWEKRSGEEQGQSKPTESVAESVADEAGGGEAAERLAEEGDLGLPNVFEGIELANRGKPVPKTVAKLRNTRY